MLPPSRLLFTLLALTLGCSGSGAPRPAPAAPLPEERPAAAAAPAELAPNVARDRRGEAGVRAPAKPLVLKGPAKCGKLGAAAVNAGAKARQEPAPLLGGRLQVSLGAPGRTIEPGPSEPALEEESRLVVQAGGAALAIVARETFQLDPDRFAPEPGAPVEPGHLDKEAPKFLRASFPTENLTVSPVALAGDVRAYAGRPKEPNAPPGGDTALVLALLIAHPDGALQSVAFHVRGELVRAATGDALLGCTRVAERIAQTITPGPRELERQQGTRRLLPLGGEKELAVTVPADYVAVRAPSPETAPLVRLYKLRPLSLYAGSIAITLSEAADDPAAAGADETVKGPLLGSEVTWKKKTLPNGGGWMFAAARPEGESRFAAVLLRAMRQASVLDEFHAVAGTLAVVTQR
jgi:hypothetical protein